MLTWRLVLSPEALHYYFLTQGNYFTVLIYGFEFNCIKEDVTFVLSDDMCHLIVLSIFSNGLNKILGLSQSQILWRVSFKSNKLLWFSQKREVATHHSDNAVCVFRLRACWIQKCLHSNKCVGIALLLSLIKHFVVCDSVQTSVI